MKTYCSEEPAILNGMPKCTLEWCSLRKEP
jgi:hypothetical protein